MLTHCLFRDVSSLDFRALGPALCRHRDHTVIVAIAIVAQFVETVECQLTNMSAIWEIRQVCSAHIGQSAPGSIGAAQKKEN